jgi:hypothetical protein
VLTVGWGTRPVAKWRVAEAAEERKDFVVEAVEGVGGLDVVAEGEARGKVPRAERAGRGLDDSEVSSRSGVGVGRAGRAGEGVSSESSCLSASG